MTFDHDLNEHPVIVFDGICNLCNGSVQGIIKRDKQRIFRFASLQSSSAKELLETYASDLREIDSIILITDSAVYIKSDAVLRIGSSLGGYLRYLSLFRIIPKLLRDAIYDWIAKNRYKWFGKRNVCMIPSPELESRFLP